jgi:hypothetical protein
MWGRLWYGFLHASHAGVNHAQMRASRLGSVRASRDYTRAMPFCCATSLTLASSSAPFRDIVLKNFISWALDS